MDDYAILVGLNQYGQHSGLDPLQGPIADVRAFEAWLLNPGGGALTGDRILKLESPPSGNGEQSDIYDAVDAVIRTARGDRLRSAPRPWARRLYLYLAGHGVFPTAAVWASTFDTALIASDWSDNLSGRYVPALELVAYLSGCNYFEEIARFLDACRDGVSQEPRPQSIPFGGDPDPQGRNSRIFIARSARRGQFAYEHSYPSDGGEVWRGAFSKAVTEGLLVAPRDSAGKLNSLQLKNYVYRRGPQLLKGGQ